MYYEAAGDLITCYRLLDLEYPFMQAVLTDDELGYFGSLRSLSNLGFISYLGYFGYLRLLSNLGIISYLVYFGSLRFLSNFCIISYLGYFGSWSFLIE